MRVLAISGSLRSASVNTVLLQALSEIALPGLEVHLFQELHAIPPFNPDLEKDANTGAVSRLRVAIREAAAVLFSTPEYAHGIPGVLKNALDWMVSSGELYGKPVALINASSRAAYAQESLKEVLTTMGASLLPAAEVTIDLAGTGLTPLEIAQNATFALPLVKAMETILLSCGPYENRCDHPSTRMVEQTK